MNNIEAIICLVLLFMVVPDVCRKLERPALAFSAFVLFGFLLGPWVTDGVRTMLLQAGQVGFLLLLFEVGLEIDLPRLKELVRPFRFAVFWALLQYPLVFVLGYWVGLDWLESLVAAAALTACSVGMAHPAWKNYPGLSPEAKRYTLSVMISLEVLAIILLAVESAALGKGLNWFIPLKLAGIAVTIFLIARFAKHLTDLFQWALERATHWRVHLLVLLVLAICALGQRLGLDAVKTAFFLGLFMSRARHEGRRLEEFMSPISHGFLIPIFFVALGLEIDWQLFFNDVVLLAMGTALVLLAAREVLHRRWLKTGGDRRAFLLLCPNLTLVALAAKVLLDHGTDSRLAAWLVLSGLFVTIPSILLLPAGTNPAAPRPPAPSAAPAVEAEPALPR